MNNIEKITSAIINNANKGTTAIAFEAETTPRMRKTNNPYFGKVKKVAHVGGLIGTNYENSVNNQLNREGKDANFTAKPRKWGVRDSEHRFIIHHKGEVYLSVKPQQTNAKTRFFNTETGEEIAKETLKPWLQESSKPATQDNLDKEIPERDYKMSALKNISIGGKKFSF
jgi:hypothetical protein